MPDSLEIAFASDTQAPMWVETLWLRSHNNRAATRLLFTELATRQPQALYLLGDIVNLGYSEAQWRPMDQYLQALRNKSVAVYGVLGNHELMGRPRLGQRKFQERFPEHSPTGYVRIHDSVAIVLLNSNFRVMTEEQRRQQQKWYESRLKELDADTAIRFVVVGCHHSPYTNSKVVGVNHEVQKHFVPPFLASPKCRLFLSGHSHNYEHFHVSGKDFMVIGGGGGLHQPLRSGSEKLADRAEDYKPLFHYLTLKRRGDLLTVVSHRLSSDYSNFQEGRTVAIAHQSSDVLWVSRRP